MRRRPADRLRRVSSVFQRSRSLQKMNRRNLIVALVGAVLILIAVLWLWGGGDGTESSDAVATEGSEENHAAEGIVELTDEQIKASQLDIVAASASSLGAEIIAQGSVATSPQGQAVLSAGAEGRVARIAKRLGDPVRRGETVATIDSREAAAITADVTSAQARAELARTRLEREQKLFDEQVTARADLETVRAEYQQALAEVSRARQAAAAANASGRTIAVRSPIAGRVTGAPVVLGSYVTAQDELYRIANANSVQIEAAVPAEDARRIAAGAAARVEAPGGEITARVLSVTPTADVENRSATVVLAPASGAGLLPGEYVRVRIESRTPEGTGGALVVPAEAVQSVDGRDVVFVRTANGFKVQPVQVGARTSERVEILGGLAAGTRIAGRKAFLLKAELGRGEAEH
ncbi:MAG: efflux RND transporter periplasmic adaptor subunit [Citromicrobium sp.]|uniref:Efflux RND transporter periplasmic adaptor subunit n=2 Tax=Alphaproteobacteria TaxID=28211 RepID=A0A419R0Z9_9SPHN|nr:efflux RND transporter periplasmic adaptor subunit [Citromicrobium sp.]MBD77175.1 efflux RND transporter periplasmic adaptor subunit [Citromicrobium sp.]MBT46518.1 efflux RND transporter periplasmic adaptor subunit [Citromicrobium sp.]RJX67594.1 efflux RND transporter periplasmic adaptor subunit [Tsuneonella suprasediminis]